jgi:hypothetical protein
MPFDDAFRCFVDAHFSFSLFLCACRAIWFLSYGPLFHLRIDDIKQMTFLLVMLIKLYGRHSLMKLNYNATLFGVFLPFLLRGVLLMEIMQSTFLFLRRAGYDGRRHNTTHLIDILYGKKQTLIKKSPR